jgi:hypothetical protein
MKFPMSLLRRSVISLALFLLKARGEAFLESLRDILRRKLEE